MWRKIGAGLAQARALIGDTAFRARAFPCTCFAAGTMVQAPLPFPPRGMAPTVPRIPPIPPDGRGRFQAHAPIGCKKVPFHYQGVGGNIALNVT